MTATAPLVGTIQVTVTTPAGADANKIGSEIGRTLADELALRWRSGRFVGA